MSTSEKNIYFASDFHLGAPDYQQSLVREKRIVQWLNQIAPNASEIYLLGDLFDFWFEYKKAVPKGFTRLLGTLAQLSDNGIKITIFTGNHDLWMKNYLQDETGLSIFYKPVIKEFNGKKFYLAHGDGLGPGDQGFKLMKKVFTNPVCQWFFARLHPNFGIGLANYFSRKSRAKTGESDAVFLGEDKEWLILHSKEILKTEQIDFFIYGHRHLPLMLPLTDKSYYINLGDWITHFTFASWNGEKLSMFSYKQNGEIVPFKS